MVTNMKYIKEDFKAYDKYNTSEVKVIKAHYFSSYKGKFVIKTPLKRSGSYGILFISKYLSLNNKDVIRHEYGHTKQLALLGFIKYTVCIGIPSLFQLSDDEVYYRRPWEITADLYGGVKSRYYRGYEEKGFIYLEKIKRTNVLFFLVHFIFDRY